MSQRFATAPHLADSRLRRRLFLPQLERYLTDPDDLPLDDSVDSVRVRIEQAITSVEKRASELREDALRRTNTFRRATTFCAAVGACALIVAVTSRPYAAIGLVVAVAECFAVVIYSRRSRLAAADAVNLAHLAERYRPRLERCETLAELRALADQIREEMRELMLDPREDGKGKGAPAE